MGAGGRNSEKGLEPAGVLSRTVANSPEWARLLAIFHQLQGSPVFPAAGVILHGVRIDTAFTLKWFVFYQALIKVIGELGVI